MHITTHITARFLFLSSLKFSLFLSSGTKQPTGETSGLVSIRSDGAFWSESVKDEKSLLTGNTADIERNEYALTSPVVTECTHHKVLTADKITTLNMNHETSTRIHLAGRHAFYLLTLNITVLFLLWMLIVFRLMFQMLKHTYICLFNANCFRKAIVSSEDSPLPSC